MLRLVLVCACLIAATAADISGTWSFTVETQAGTGNPVFVFEQQGEKLTGTYTGLLGKAQLNGTVKGDKIQFEFTASYEGQSIRCRYSGTIESPTRMKGTVEFAELGTGTWTAEKK